MNLRPSQVLRMILTAGVALVALMALILGTAQADEPKPGERIERQGDEIVVCGQLFHTTTPVVLWMDPGGYDAYRVERRFVPLEEASWEKSRAAGLDSPNRYGTRSARLSPEQVEQVRGGGWDLPTLRKVVDQFVIHYDVCGTSKRCFQVLHDARGLSVHFMLDVDGTIYQTMDLKEKAWHATIANSRSIGIEIANMGAYPVGGANPFDRWYARDPDGTTRLTIPGGVGAADLHNPKASLRPARDEPIVGTVQGTSLVQYDLTPEQYDSLIRLTATLCTVFPEIRCDAPRDANGEVIPHKLPSDQLAGYQGVLGHYHVQTNKTDPGPAFQWDKVLQGARELMGPRRDEPEDR